MLMFVVSNVITERSDIVGMHFAAHLLLVPMQNIRFTCIYKQTGELQNTERSRARVTDCCNI